MLHNERSPYKIHNDCFIFAVAVLGHFCNMWEEREMERDARKMSTGGHFEKIRQGCVLRIDL